MFRFILPRSSIPEERSNAPISIRDFMQTSRNTDMRQGPEPQPSPSMRSKTFRFLDLPRELRNDIYTQSLSPTPQSPHILWSADHGRARSFGITPALLRTNKQINEEAKTHLYEKSQATYHIDLSAGNHSHYGADFGGPESAHRDVLEGYEYTLRPAYRGPEFHCKRALDVKDAHQGDNTAIPKVVITLAAHRLEKDAPMPCAHTITGATILRIRHLKLSFSTGDSWQRVNKWEEGRQSWKGWLVTYFLEILAGRETFDDDAGDMTRTLTLVMAYESHYALPGHGMELEVTRNRRMLVLLRTIRDGGTKVRIVQPDANRDDSLGAQEGVEGGRSGTISAADVFGGIYDGFHEPDCEYCRRSGEESNV